MALDRRQETRPDSSDRRTSPRPPLWLNLTLLILALAGFAYAKHQRDVIRERTNILFQPGPSNPAELNRIREQLSAMDLTRAQLDKELAGRTEFLESVKSAQFYVSVDTNARKLYFRLGDDVVREAPITIGEGKTVKSVDGTKSWTFVPLKGAFTIEEKRTDYRWTLPEWVYALQGKPTPAARDSVRDGLGKYVIFLPDNYVIHSPPPPDSPLAGMAKPGSIMVPEEDLAAIWPRLSTKQTRVYIF